MPDIASDIPLVALAFPYKIPRSASTAKLICTLQGPFLNEYLTLPAPYFLSTAIPLPTPSIPFLHSPPSESLASHKTHRVSWSQEHGSLLIIRHVSFKQRLFFARAGRSLHTVPIQVSECCSESWSRIN